jgi:hypothetical protein
MAPRKVLERPGQECLCRTIKQILSTAAKISKAIVQHIKMQQCDAAKG